MSIERVLQDLTQADQPIRPTRLASLSNLPAGEIERFTAVWAGIDVEHRRRIVTQLVELAEDNVQLNFDAILQACLSDPDAVVRERAIEGLWECDDRSVIQALVDRLRHDPTETVRAAAASALGRFAIKAELEELRPRDWARIEDALLATLSDPAEPVSVRRRAVEAIGARSVPMVRTIIEEAYASADPHMRASALFAMGRNCDPRWLPVLYEELGNLDPQIRFEAVTACGEIGEEEAIPRLLPLLEDADIQVQLSAVTALGHIGGRLARETLQRCLRHPDPRVRDAAEDAIEELKISSDSLGFS